MQNIKEFICPILLKSKLIDKLLFALILGGALGNFYDRIVYKAVPDFIDLHYDNFHWFTFNVADIFAVIIAVPTSKIVTAPVLETVATSVLLEVYVIGSPEILETPANV